MLYDLCIWLILKKWVICFLVLLGRIMFLVLLLLIMVEFGVKVVWVLVLRLLWVILKNIEVMLSVMICLFVSCGIILEMKVICRLGILVWSFFYLVWCVSRFLGMLMWLVLFLVWVVCRCVVIYIRLVLVL